MSWRCDVGVLNDQFDCLACITIIESGFDFPNYNTLIVGNADWFKLAQSPAAWSCRALKPSRYAYFTFNGDKVLTEQAEKRLRALRSLLSLEPGFSWQSVIGDPGPRYPGS